MFESGTAVVSCPGRKTFIRWIEIWGGHISAGLEMILEQA